jgi:hypothetical protein
MYWAVKKVQAQKNYMLHLTFENGEQKQFDMKPYLEHGIFQELKDVNVFNSVRICFDTIEWDNEADFDPEVLYSKSQPAK